MLSHLTVVLKTELVVDFRNVLSLCPGCFFQCLVHRISKLL